MTIKMWWLPEKKGGAGQHLMISSGLSHVRVFPLPQMSPPSFPAYLSWSPLK